MPVEYPTIEQLVTDRAHDNPTFSLSDLRTISVRLEPYRVEELDLLAAQLGYASRQQVTAELLSTAIENALDSLSTVLQTDEAAHRNFTAERLRIMEDHHGVTAD